MSKHYLIDENHNLVEGYSAQEVLSILEQAIADGSLANVVAGQAIVDKLKCCVTGGTNQVAFVTQAKYNELKASGSLVNNCMYIITDDTTAEDIEATLTTLSNTVNGIMDGSKPVPKADDANYADSAGKADKDGSGNNIEETYLKIDDTPKHYNHLISLLGGTCSFSLVTKHGTDYMGTETNGESRLIRIMNMMGYNSEGTACPASGYLSSSNGNWLVYGAYAKQSTNGKWTDICLLCIKFGTSVTQDALSYSVNSSGNVNDIVTEV